MNYRQQCWTDGPDVLTQTFSDLHRVLLLQGKSKGGGDYPTREKTQVRFS